MIEIMRKNRFFGIYYKHQSLDGEMLAVIDSLSNEGKMVQIISNEGAFILKDLSSIKISFEGISFDIHQDDLILTGEIKYGNIKKPKKDIMSYYRFLPIECKHKIYSLYHPLSGEIIINNKKISFDHGDGYIEGDKGRNFPSKYIWINSSSPILSITSAIASIPLGLFTITGNTTSILYKNKEYRFGTYNGSKVIKISKEHIIIKKGAYTLEMSLLDNKSSHPLKAPQRGDMIRYIHECPSLSMRMVLKRKDRLIFNEICPFTSYEYVWE